MHTQTQRDIITTIFSIFKNGLPLRTGHTTCAQQRAHAGHARGANRRPRLLGRDTSERTSEAVSETGDRRHRSALRKTSRFATNKVQPAPGFRRFAGPLRRPEKKRTRLFFQIGATCGKDGARGKDDAKRGVENRRACAYELRLQSLSADAKRSESSSSAPTRRARPRHDSGERSSSHGGIEAASRIASFTRSANAGRSSGSGSSTPIMRGSSMKATGARALETPTTGARPQIAHRHPAPMPAPRRPRGAALRKTTGGRTRRPRGTPSQDRLGTNAPPAQPPPRAAPPARRADRAPSPPHGRRRTRNAPRRPRPKSSTASSRLPTPLLS